MNGKYYLMNGIIAALIQRKLLFNRGFPIHQDFYAAHQCDEKIRF